MIAFLIPDGALVYLKQQALAGNIDDYPSLYQFLQSLYLQYVSTDSILYALKLRLQKLALAGGIWDFLSMYNGLEEIITPSAPPIL